MCLHSTTPSPRTRRLPFLLSFVVSYRGLGREDINQELIESLLEGAARFAEDVVAPTNEAGDRIGVRRTDDGRVYFSAYLQAGADMAKPQGLDS